MLGFPCGEKGEPLVESASKKGETGARRCLALPRLPPRGGKERGGSIERAVSDVPLRKGTRVDLRVADLSLVLLGCLEGGERKKGGG